MESVERPADDEELVVLDEEDDDDTRKTDEPIDDEEDELDMELGGDICFNNFEIFDELEDCEGANVTVKLRFLVTSTLLKPSESSGISLGVGCLGLNFFESKLDSRWFSFSS